MRTRLACCLWIAALAVTGCRLLPFGSGTEKPYRDEKADADLQAALDRIAALQYAEALKILPQVLQAYDDARNPSRAAEAAFWAGYCSEKLGRTDGARYFYGLVLREYPETRAARHAAERLPRLPPRNARPPDPTAPSKPAREQKKTGQG